MTYIPLKRTEAQQKELDKYLVQLQKDGAMNTQEFIIFANNKINGSKENKGESNG